MKFEDLPTAVQAKVRAQLGEAPRRPRDRSVSHEPGIPLYCHTCGACPPSDAKRAEHCLATGHNRFEWRKDDL